MEEGSSYRPTKKTIDKNLSKHGSLEAILSFTKMSTKTKTGDG